MGTMNKELGPLTIIGLVLIFASIMTLVEVFFPRGEGPTPKPDPIPVSLQNTTWEVSSTGWQWGDPDKSKTYCHIDSMGFFNYNKGKIVGILKHIEANIWEVVREDPFDGRYLRLFIKIRKNKLVFLIQDSDWTYDMTSPEFIKIKKEK
jgi:hypothetical protein